MDRVGELLDELSLKAFISVHNTYAGGGMTRKLRRWHIDIDLRFNDRKKFTVKNEKSLKTALEKAKYRIDDWYNNHPDRGWEPEE